MPEERREQQSFHLNQDNQSICNDTINGNKIRGVQGTLLLSRWLRISLRVHKDTSCVFNNSTFAHAKAQFNPINRHFTV